MAPAVLAAVILLGCGCTATGAGTSPAPSTTARPVAGWLIDRLDGEVNDRTGESHFAALCTPAAFYSASANAPEEVIRTVAITEPEFRTLQPGDPCPAIPAPATAVTAADSADKG